MLEIQFEIEQWSFVGLAKPGYKIKADDSEWFCQHTSLVNLKDTQQDAEDGGIVLDSSRHFHYTFINEMKKLSAFSLCFLCYAVFYHSPKFTVSLKGSFIVFIIIKHSELVE